MIELLNCDCMEYMATVPDKYFDLCLVDPPYGIKNMNAGGRGMDGWTSWAKKDWDNAAPDKKYFEELARISKHQIIWGGNYFDLPPSKCWIIWDKGVADGMTLSAGELAWTSFKKNVKKVSLLWAGFRRCEDVKRIHPTQKPVALYEWLLTNYAKKGQRVFDSHLGSASSAIAAHYFGVDFVGTELDKDYFEAAKARFDMATKQLAMSI